MGSWLVTGRLSVRCVTVMCVGKGGEVGTKGATWGPQVRGVWGSRFGPGVQFF